MSMLDGELATEVADALSSAAIPYDLTLTRVIVPDSPAYDPGPAVSVDYTCKGFVDDIADALTAGNAVQTGDAQIVIVASTLPIEPKPCDYITTRGKSYVILAVKADPALATYTLRARQ